VKKNELENKSFFGCVIHRSRERFRILYSMVCRNVVDWFDSFHALLLLFSLYIFFDYLLPMSTFFLGSISPVYVYSWLILWVVIAVLLANREVNRRSKTVTSPKWFHNPNAINEYLELMKKQN